MGSAMILKSFLRPAVAFIVFLGMLPVPARAQSGWFSSSWAYRNPITITNTSGSTLTNFQVKIALGGSFDFTKAKSDGSDVLITAGDGVTPISFWIETWNPSSQSATLWVQAPSVPTSGTTLYMYYGNPSASSASNGNATFLFFDDFASPAQAPGYWTLGPVQTDLVRDQAWETAAPHTLSVLKLSMRGHTYWGYYGLQNTCGGVGLAWSEDLVTWTKDSSNPLFSNGRWPRVIQVGSTLYMAYTANYCQNSQINLASSNDGVTWTVVKTLVPANYGGMPRNQNPDLWLNPNDGQYYLYWYNGDDLNAFNILSRSASSPAGLDSTLSEVHVLSSPSTLAAPDIFFHGGKYFLSTEVQDGNGLWNVVVYASTAGPTSGFSELPGNPVMNNGAACMFQTPVGATLHEYYCQLTNGIWTLQHRTADLTSTQPLYATFDPAKWTASGGSWKVVQDTKPDGRVGNTIQGTTSAVQLLNSAFSGTDYVLEAYGKQQAGRVWGLGFRAASPGAFYSANLYDDLNGSQNLFAYHWSNGASTTLGNASVGTVSPKTWYKLAVHAQGSTFDIYKDDVFQLHTADASFGSGGIALYGEKGTVANFTNILVRKLASADPSASLGPQQVPPQATLNIASLALSPASVSGGSPSTGTVTLDAAAPVGGAVITLSSNSAAATVPASVTVPAGATTVSFSIATKAVGAATSVAVSAINSSGTKSAILTVNPPSLTSVSVSSSTMFGGFPGEGTVTISSPAPAGGIVVALSSSTSAAGVPSHVTIPAGAKRATFQFSTSFVFFSKDAAITASFGGVTKTATFTIFW
jgi:hypothetical protein